jgi:hypothetical protein
VKMRYSAHGAMNSRHAALISNCNQVVCFSRPLLPDESVQHSFLRRKMLVAKSNILLLLVTLKSNALLLRYFCFSMFQLHTLIY